MLLMSKCRSESLPLVLDVTEIDSSLPLRSLSHLDLCLSAPDLVELGPAPLTRDSCHLGLMSLASGLTCLDFVSTPSVIDETISGFVSFLKSPARTEPLAPVLSHVRLDFVLLLRSHSWLELVLLVPDPLHLGPMLSLQSSACGASLLPVLDLLHLGPSPLLHTVY